MERRLLFQTLAGAAFTGDFSFVHFTDPHIQPKLRAVEGYRDCFAKIQKLKPDFVLAGGDLVFDANETTAPRKCRREYRHWSVR